MGTLRDSTLQPSELARKEDFVFQQNKDMASGALGESDRLLLKPGNAHTEGKSRTNRAELRRIKNLSLMKMINTGLHHDRKQLNAKQDSQVVNLKSFKKYFKKVAAASRRHHEPENSPYYRLQSYHEQSALQPYLVSE